MRHASFHIIMNPWLETRVCGYVDTVGEDVPGKLMEIETNYDHYIVRAATSGRVTASHPNSEVKLPRVSVVLRWGTTREGDMLHVPFFLKHDMLHSLFSSSRPTRVSFTRVSFRFDFRTARATHVGLHPTPTQ